MSAGGCHTSLLALRFVWHRCHIAWTFSHRSSGSRSKSCRPARVRSAIARLLNSAANDRRLGDVPNGADTTPALERAQERRADAATRGAVIQTLLEAFDVPLDEASAGHRDLRTSHPHARAIPTATRLGLVSGDTDRSGESTDTVRSDDPVNRAEVAKLISLLLASQR